MNNVSIKWWFCGLHYISFLLTQLLKVNWKCIFKSSRYNDCYLLR